MKKEPKVSYMTHVEKEWLQQGIEQGVQKGESMFLLELLKGKFKTVPASYSRKIVDASPECLLAWGLRVLNSHTIDEVFED